MEQAAHSQRAASSEGHHRNTYGLTPPQTVGTKFDFSDAITFEKGKDALWNESARSILLVILQWAEKMKEKVESLHDPVFPLMFLFLLHGGRFMQIAHGLNVCRDYLYLVFVDQTNNRV